MDETLPQPPAADDVPQLTVETIQQRLPEAVRPATGLLTDVDRLLVPVTDAEPPVRRNRETINYLNAAVHAGAPPPDTPRTLIAQLKSWYHNLVAEDGKEKTDANLRSLVWNTVLFVAGAFLVEKVAETLDSLH
jgi:hypothetical protein